MPNIFLVLGYGIPKDIFKDEHYNFYLKIVFNKIYSIGVENKNPEALIIFCGGKTDMRRPYTRTEGGEMLKLFASFIKNRPFIKEIAKNWKLVAEKRSLSTLDNLIYGKEIIEKSNVRVDKMFIFCEQTREHRVKVAARGVFGKNYTINVLPIDFDMSSNRYLAPDFLKKKEQLELKHLLWALKNNNNLRQHRKLFIEKIQYLRKIGHKKHAIGIRTWWEEKMREFEKSSKP